MKCNNCDGDDFAHLIVKGYVNNCAGLVDDDPEEYIYCCKDCGNVQWF